MAVEAIERDGMREANFGGRVGGRRGGGPGGIGRGKMGNKLLRQDIGMGAWIQRQDEVTGAVFYYNTQTEESSWTKPVVKVSCFRLFPLVSLFLSLPFPSSMFFFSLFFRF